MNRNRNVAKKYSINKNKQLLQKLMKQNKEQNNEGNGDGKAK